MGCNCGQKVKVKESSNTQTNTTNKPTKPLKRGGKIVPRKCKGNCHD